MIFFLFHIEIEGKGGWIIGGPKGMLAPPPPKLLGGGGGGGAGPPLPTPMFELVLEPLENNPIAAYLG